MSLLLPLLVHGAVHGAIELTPENFYETIDGKFAFVKFLAPW